MVAHMELQPDTKTVLEKNADGRYYPLWEVSDSLAVFTAPGQSPTAFKLIDGEGTSEGLFEGPLSGERYVAVSPYDSRAKWTDNQLELVLPEHQRRITPMIAVSDNGELNFRNLCSVIKLSLTGSCVVGSIKLHSDDHYLSGPAVVDLSYTDSPILVMKDGGSHDVQTDCGAVLLNKETASEFFILVPPGTYDGLTICIDTYTDNITKSISQEVVLRRSELRPVSSFLVEAPMLDLDAIPDNQIWYKTQSGAVYTPEQWGVSSPLNARILSNTYYGDYGVIITDKPITSLRDYAFNPEEYYHYNPSLPRYGERIIELHLPDCVEEFGYYSIPQRLNTLRVPSHLNNGGMGNWQNLYSVYGPLVDDDGHSVVRDGRLMGVVQGDLKDYVTPQSIHTIMTGSVTLSNMNSVSFSDGVRVIELQALNFAAERMVLPESIEKIGEAQVLQVNGFYGSPHCTTEDHICLINPRSSYGPQVVGIVPGRDDESYSVPEGVRMLSAPFSNWPNLKKVVLPESLVRINTIPLIFDCPKFEGFYGPKVSEDGCCFISYGTLLYFHDKGYKEYTLPPEVLCVEAFSNIERSSIETLIFSDGTKDIDYNCFENATALKTVVFPTTLSFIGTLAFDNCVNLESIYLPVRVPPVLKGAMSSVPIPRLKVYVPEESYDDYMADPVWKATYGQNLISYHFDKIDPPVPYESSDYSKDGVVTVLQSASEGKGIDLIFMGNDFTDRQIEDGTYLSVMEKVVEAFFEPEPYRSFRSLFNVYVVNIVSRTSDGYPSNFVSDSFAYLQEQYGKSIEYAQKAIPDERLDEATVTMICNAPGLGVGYYGICTYWNRFSTPVTDYGSGMGVAIFPTTEMQALVKHETGGHGFGKLDDEYHPNCDIDCPEAYIEFHREDQKRGYWKNVDFTTDVSSVLWSKFLSDSRYQNERLGIYEGAGADYDYGIYRPSERSIMVNDCQGGFNAPSREAIYYRIHKLAYGPEWEYNYEDFVKWDQGAKNIHPTATPHSVSGKKTYEVREPLPSKPFNPDEWMVTVMK